MFHILLPYTVEHCPINFRLNCFIAGIGALLFALPHVLIGKYKPSYTGDMGGLCDPGQTTCNIESDSRWYYMFIFFVAQVIIGAGVSPLYSLVPAYLDENVHPKSMPVYLGIWQVSIFAGPGVGMAVAGKFLSIYVDIDQVCRVFLDNFIDTTTTRCEQYHYIK